MQIDWTKPIEFITKNGRTSPARVICTDRKGPFPILVLVKDAAGELLYSTDLSGDDCGFKRFRNVPVRHKWWVNVYKEGQTMSPYKTREEADRYASALRTACLEIEFTEGEGLTS